MTSQDEIRVLQRIAQAIEKFSPEPEPMANIKSADAFVWDGQKKQLLPVVDVHHIDLSLLMGVEQARDALVANTQQFVKGFSANNALLWGARGMGKSSLIKAVWAATNKGIADPLKRLAIVEIHREELATLPQLIHALRGWVIRRFIIYCDDLSFDSSDTTYKSLKTVLEGGIEAKPDHILFYATSNRRHLMAREMIDNEIATAIHPSEANEEKISLSDRFGLWLGFHSCTQDMYLAMIDAYAERYKLTIEKDALHAQAINWAQTRGARSGRVAWQFIQDAAGRLGKRVG